MEVNFEISISTKMSTVGNVCHGSNLKRRREKVPNIGFIYDATEDGL
jgi:hypothetical protein